MRVRRVPLGLVVPALLVGLVAVLATMQYRWLGKVSEAEREQLRRSLDQRAREFADDLDGEISRVYLSLQIPASAVAASDWTTFAAAVDRWRNTARFPRLVRGIYLAEAAGERRTLRAYDTETRAFGAATEAWPTHLAPVRSQLGGARAPAAPSPDGKRQVVAITFTPLVPDLPALLIPVSNPAPPPDLPSTPAAARFWLPWGGAYVLADLDGEYLRQTVLPALVARHFPGEGPDVYRVAVLAADGSAVFTRGAGKGTALDPERADVVVPIFNLRLDIVRDLVPGADTIAYRARIVGGSDRDAKKQPPATGGQQMAFVLEHRSGAPGPTVRGAGPAQVRLLRPGWRLVLRHPSGSLDAAVLQVRQRNLWLSFGILAVLAAGVVLVVVNARRSSQLAARQMDFVATVSHELRTPLTVIRSAAQNLSAGVVSDPGQARRYGELIEDEGRRLTETVEQVLEYAGLGSGRTVTDSRPVEVRGLLEEVAASCQRLCEQAGVTLEVSAEAEGLPAVPGDEGALRRALHNLVTNAVKHAPEGRWVRVAARVEEARGRREVAVTVSDRGPGIDASDLRHVFEPFYRGRQAIERQVQGNGLGLSLVKRVAEAHGGSVTVKTAAGEGTSFTLHLPALASAPATHAVGDPAPQAGSPA